MESEPTNKAELLARLEEGYAALERLLAPLNEEALTRPGVENEWSIKDILVHLTTWQGRSSSILEAAQCGKVPRPDPPIHNDEEMNAFNDGVFAANRSRPLAEVRRDFQAMYQRFHASVAALSENDLFEEARFSWMDGRPLWHNVAGNGFGHYQEHEPFIAALLAQQQR